MKNSSDLIRSTKSSSEMVSNVLVALAVANTKATKKTDENHVFFMIFLDTNQIYFNFKKRFFLRLRKAGRVFSNVLTSDILTICTSLCVTV